MREFCTLSTPKIQPQLCLKVHFKQIEFPELELTVQLIFQYDHLELRIVPPIAPWPHEMRFMSISFSEVLTSKIFASANLQNLNLLSKVDFQMTQQSFRLVPFPFLHLSSVVMIHPAHCQRCNADNISLCSDLGSLRSASPWSRRICTNFQ